MRLRALKDISDGKTNVFRNQKIIPDFRIDQKSKMMSLLAVVGVSSITTYAKF